MLNSFIFLNSYLIFCQPLKKKRSFQKECAQQDRKSSPKSLAPPPQNSPLLKPSFTSFHMIVITFCRCKQQSKLLGSRRSLQHRSWAKGIFLHSLHRHCNSWSGGTYPPANLPGIFITFQRQNSKTPVPMYARHPRCMCTLTFQHQMDRQSTQSRFHSLSGFPNSSENKKAQARPHFFPLLGKLISQVGRHSFPAGLGSAYNPQEVSGNHNSQNSFVPN